MAKYVFVVMTNAVAGQEAEFNRWYDEEHLADVLKLPGMVSAQRFQVKRALHSVVAGKVDAAVPPEREAFLQRPAVVFCESPVRYFVGYRHNLFGMTLRDFV